MHWFTRAAVRCFGWKRPSNAPWYSLCQYVCRSDAHAALHASLSACHSMSSLTLCLSHSKYQRQCCSPTNSAHFITKHMTPNGRGHGQRFTLIVPQGEIIGFLLSINTWRGSSRKRYTSLILDIKSILIQHIIHASKCIYIKINVYTNFSSVTSDPTSAHWNDWLKISELMWAI